MVGGKSNFTLGGMDWASVCLCAPSGMLARPLAYAYFQFLLAPRRRLVLGKGAVKTEVSFNSSFVCSMGFLTKKKKKIVRVSEWHFLASATKIIIRILSYT